MPLCPVHCPADNYNFNASNPYEAEAACRSHNSSYHGGQPICSYFCATDARYPSEHPQLKTVEEALKFLKDTMPKSEEIESAVTGACVYTAGGGGPYCAQLTQTQCGQIGGTWFANQACPRNFGDE